ncbi:MAG: HD domain-containing protein [Anaerolineae bacterium]|nr:HD domain-containing protein [Anaerolineae bacterium]
MLAPVEAWVRQTLDQAGSTTHGWLHTERVRRHIRLLARAEGVDPLLAELAALLHDVGRSQAGPESEQRIHFMRAFVTQARQELIQDD